MHIWEGQSDAPDHGKNAYTFVRRSDNRAVRVSGRSAAAVRAPGWQELFAQVRTRTATPEERAPG